jgi:rare lipoprotein A
MMTPFSKKHNIFYLLICTLIMSSCSVKNAAHQRPDGAPSVQLNILRIPDAKPKIEVISKRGNPPSYKVKGKRYHVRDTARGFTQRGIASWYGTKFHKRSTSSGEPYNMYQMTAAHKTLPIPCYARITNLNNHRSIVVKINDRGPFHKGRIVDLSYAAAKKLDVHGVAPVFLRTIAPFPYQREVPSRFYHVAVLKNYSQARALRRRLHFYLDLNIDIKTFRTKQGKLRYLVQVGPLYTIKDYMKVKKTVTNKRKALAI